MFVFELGRRSQQDGGKAVSYWEGETRLVEGHGWLVQEKGGLLFLLMSWSFILPPRQRPEVTFLFGF